MSMIEKRFLKLDIQPIDYQPTFEEPEDDDCRRFEVTITHQKLGKFVITDVRSTDTICETSSAIAFRGFVFTDSEMSATAKFPSEITLGVLSFQFDKTGKCLVLMGELIWSKQETHTIEDLLLADDFYED